MSTLRLDLLDATPLRRDPYDFLVVRNFLKPEALNAARVDYPKVPGPGSHPAGGLDIKGGFKQVIDDFHGPEFRHAIERKFDVDLTDRPLMYTVRGHCRARDGQIHTDTKSKIITILLYMNDDHWDNANARLRILRNGTDLNDYVDEVEPAGGTLLVFRRCDHSWHGHTSYEGPRRALQFNYVTDQAVVDREQSRHSVSAFFKKLMGRDTMTM
ncbi:MAG: 2OG-Fe(II) oxygenase [Burkholderiales bacterium]|nr:2OG-Fe(II) oxygenase [Burkholderiales bacterium]